MNIIYNALLRSDRNYSATELKYFSHLISTMPATYDFGFDRETGKLNQDEMIEFLDQYCSEGEEDTHYTISLSEHNSNRKIAKAIKTDEKNIRKIKEKFFSDGVMTESDLIFPKEVITDGYFHLTETPELYNKPALHITYSFLVSMSKHTAGICRLMKYKLARLLNTDESNIKTHLHRLSKMGFIERVENGWRINQ